MKMRVGALALLCLGLMACEDLGSGPGKFERQNAMGEPMLPLGDPCPSCDGIFLTGNAADHVQCILSPSQDADHDGVDDLCEFKIAQAFAPELVFHSNETRTSRETYWAVHRDPAGYDARRFV